MCNPAVIIAEKQHQVAQKSKVSKCKSSKKIKSKSKCREFSESFSASNDSELQFESKQSAEDDDPDIVTMAPPKGKMFKSGTTMKATNVKLKVTRSKCLCSAG